MPAPEGKLQSPKPRWAESWDITISLCLLTGCRRPELLARTRVVGRTRRGLFHHADGDLGRVMAPGEVLDQETDVGEPPLNGRDVAVLLPGSPPRTRGNHPATLELLLQGFRDNAWKLELSQIERRRAELEATIVASDAGPCYLRFTRTRRRSTGRRSNVSRRRSHMRTRSSARRHGRRCAGSSIRSLFRPVTRFSKCEGISEG